MTSNQQDDLPALLALLGQSARIYLHRINWLAERAYLVEADREFFRRANFLDERALSPDVKGRWVPLDALRRSVLADQPVPPGACHFIFHLGHCGSTLMSRAQANDKTSGNAIDSPEGDASIARGINGGWGQNSGTANTNARSLEVKGETGGGQNRGRKDRGRPRD